MLVLVLVRIIKEYEGPADILIRRESDSKGYTSAFNLNENSSLIRY